MTMSERMAYVRSKKKGGPRKMKTEKNCKCENYDMKGAGFIGDAAKWLKNKAIQGYKYIKDNRLATKALRTYGESNPGSLAGQAAYLGSYLTEAAGLGKINKRKMMIMKRF